MNTVTFGQLQVYFLTHLAIGRDGEQRLLSTDQLDGTKGGEGLRRRGNFDLCPFDASQLSAMVVTPAIDGAAAARRQSPVIRTPDTAQRKKK